MHNVSNWDLDDGKYDGVGVGVGDGVGVCMGKYKMQPGPFCSRESITIMGTRTKSIDDVHIAVLENDTHQNAKHRKRRTKIFINNLQIEEQLWKTTFFPTTTKKKINSIDESHLKAHRSFKICGKIVCVFFFSHWNLCQKYWTTIFYDVRTTWGRFSVYVCVYGKDIVLAKIISIYTKV